MKVKILVATHKNYAMPEDDLYLPVFVGKDLHPNINHTFHGDNTGDNISKLNPYYNELTALYWGWKNLDLDAMGLVHYRRYLSLNKAKDLNRVLNKKQTLDLLSQYDIILPQKRRYFVETNESHYLHAHHKEPYWVLKKIIHHDYPAYANAFDNMAKATSAHMFNMFIMKKEPLDDYCTWMFEVLRKLDEHIDTSGYSSYEQRALGFLSELLLDVWLEAHPQYKTHDVKFVFMEHQNWLKKGGNFLKRKFVGHP